MNPAEAPFFDLLSLCFRLVAAVALSIICWAVLIGLAGFLLSLGLVALVSMVS